MNYSLNLDVQKQIAEPAALSLVPSWISHSAKSLDNVSPRRIRPQIVLNGVQYRISGGPSQPMKVAK